MLAANQFVALAMDRVEMRVRPGLPSFKLVQVGVGCRMAERATHGNHLALVMKCMGQNMVKDKCGGADGTISIGEVKLN